LLMEREGVDPGTREATLPYVPLLLAAWRGDATEAAGLAGEMARGAADRGEGAALTYTDYAQAVLYNGQGNYRAAAGAAGAASGVDEIVISPWAPMSWWKPRHEAIRPNALARRLISCRRSPWRAPATGLWGRRRGPGRWYRGDLPPRRSTARRSSCWAGPGWRPTWP